MESIYSLIKCLNKSEFDTVRAFYSCQLQGIPDVEKSLNLLDFLRKSTEEPSKDTVMQHVYGKQENASFRQLKSRLTQRILDTIITETNLDKIDSIEQYDIIAIKLRKKITQVLYLYSTKGNIPVVYELLNSAVKSGEEYCVYSVLIEALRLKKMLLAIRGTDAERAEAEERLSYYERCDSGRNKAVSYYFDLIRKADHKASASKEEIQVSLKNAIDELKPMYEELKAPSIGYYLKFIEMAYYSNQGKFQSAKESCLDQIALLKSKELYKKERVGMTYDNIGHFEIMVGNPENSIEFFKKAQEYFKENSINITLSKEQEFFGNYYSHRLNDALSLVNQLLIHNPQDQGAFRHAKYQYFKAALLFKKGDFTGCQRIISQNLEISSDKGGWDIATRFLMIQCNIELEEYDVASLQLQSLKKHIERTRKKEEISARDVLIYKALLLLDKQGYQWSLLGPGNLPMLSELSKVGSETSWRPFSPELIRFDEWLKGKVNTKKSTVRAVDMQEVSRRTLYQEIKR